MRCPLFLLFLFLLNGSALAWDEKAKIVSGGNLAVQTHKYEGKLIQTSLHCFYADVHDIRCLTNMGTARVDFMSVSDTEVEDALLSNCDDIETAFLKPHCHFDVQFVYGGFLELNDGITKTMLVVPKMGTGQFRPYSR